LTINKNNIYIYIYALINNLIINIFKNLTIESKPKIKINTYNIYVLRPTGEVCVITDLEYSSLDCFEVLILTGNDQGKKKMIRRREIIKGIKSSNNHIDHYQIHKYHPSFTCSSLREANEK
jgi:hypothetical protein